MKVRDFWNSLPNKAEMLNKIRQLKDLKRKEYFLAQYQSCATCGSQIKFAHASNYFTYSIIESCSCPQCGQQAVERRFTLN